VHVRGKYGLFLRQGILDNNIKTRLAIVFKSIIKWVGNRKNDDGDGDGGMTTVGLYVATDIPDVLRNHTTFQESMWYLRKFLQQTRNITVKLLRMPRFWRNDTLTEYVGYPEIFIDQQLAACASIDFVGTPWSTFSMMIDDLRRRGEAAC
jgi:hypothetical protein